MEVQGFVPTFYFEEFVGPCLAINDNFCSF